MVIGIIQTKIQYFTEKLNAAGLDPTTSNLDLFTEWKPSTIEAIPSGFTLFLFIWLILGFFIVLIWFIVYVKRKKNEMKKHEKSRFNRK